MALVVEQSNIARSSDIVWETLADYGGISRWAPNVDHSCMATGDSGGVHAVRRVQVGRNALLERIVEWEPNRRVAYEIVGLPPVVRSATNTWEVAEFGDGTTVTLTTHIDAGPRPPQQLVARVMGRVMGRASRQMLSGLRRHLEEAAT